MVDLYMRDNIRVGEKYETVKCPLCGSDDYDEFLNLGSYKFVKCKRCDLVYQNPQPIDQNIEVRYDNNYFEYEIKNHEKFFNLQKLTLKDIDFYKKFLPANNKKFLDIGSATGLLLNHMKNLGFDTYGVELCKESAEYAKEKFGLKIYNTTLENAKFRKNYFDIIHFSHLIEHLKKPVDFMFEVRRILKPGGYILVTTPRIDSPAFKIYKEDWRSAIPDHLQLFSEKTLYTLIENTGFDIIFKESWGFIPIDKKFPLIKKYLNKLAKKFNFGDVIFMMAKKV